MAGTVLVTGGSGYIAGYLIEQLVGIGWTVNTTVRSLAKEGDVRRLLNVDQSKVKFFAADLTSDNGWAEAVAGCSHVAHVASPFPSNVPKDENELIVPARDGALRALRHARDAGVTRFVMTSSAAAIAYGHEGARTTYSEADWTNLNAPGTQPYIKSKTIAERAARDWVAKEGKQIEYCAINPTAILGPVRSDDYATSVQLIKRLLEGSVPACPDIGFGIVDVRDVADLHVRALTTPGMAGERFAASGPFLKMIEIANILRAELGSAARKVPTRRLPAPLVRMMATFDGEVRQLVGELGKTRALDASHAKDRLGWVPRPVEGTIIDTARSLIEHGIVKG